MTEIRLDIPGQPVPQPRPRHSSRGGISRTYVPARHPIHDYRAAVTLVAQAKGGKAVDGYFEVEIWCHFERPRSHWVKSGLAASSPEYPIVGDWDNLGKGVCDAITTAGTIWADDRLVVDGRVVKRYCGRNEKPRTVVVIRRLPP